MGGFPSHVFGAFGVAYLVFGCFGVFGFCMPGRGVAIPSESTKGTGKDAERAREGEGRRAEHLGVCSWLNRLGFAWQGPFGCDQARSGFGMGKYHPKKSRELTKNNLYVLLGAYWRTRRKVAVGGRRTKK